MQTLAEIREYVSQVIEDNSEDTLMVIDMWINKALKSLCDKYIWSGYSRTRTITPDSNGSFYVPAAFSGVIRIYPANDSFGSFTYLSISSLRGNRIAEPYYIEGEPLTEDEKINTDATITNNSKNISTATAFFNLTDDLLKPVIINNNGYEYEISQVIDDSNAVLSLPYRGESIAGTSSIIVNPAGRRRFIVYDSDGTPYTNDIVLVYKINPQPLYNDTDRPLINADEALKFGALIESLRNEKYSVDAERIKNDYFDAVANARQSEVKAPKKRLPEGLITPLPPFSFKSNRSFRGGR